VIDRLEQTLLPDKPRLVHHSLAVKTRHRLIASSTQVSEGGLK
jgi:hypothetical protein